jgi:hypothetical protein
MITHANKPPENKSQSVAYALSHRQGRKWSAFHFLDNRPEAVAQRNLQRMANNRRQVNQLTTIQEVGSTGGEKPGAPRPN